MITSTISGDSTRVELCSANSEKAPASTRSRLIVPYTIIVRCSPRSSQVQGQDQFARHSESSSDGFQFFIRIRVFGFSGNLEPFFWTSRISHLFDCLFLVQVLQACHQVPTRVHQSLPSPSLCLLTALIDPTTPSPRPVQLVALI